jgi:hypothetical protein
VLTAIEASAGAAAGAGAAVDSGALQSQRVLSVADSAALFLSSVEGFFAGTRVDTLGAAEVCLCLSVL